MDGKINTLEAKISALEAKIDALETKMDVQFESQQRQLDDLKTLFYWGFGIMVSLFMFMFGYIIWNHHTAMKPALQQASEAKDKNTTLTTVELNLQRRFSSTIVYPQSRCRTIVSCGIIEQPFFTKRCNRAVAGENG